jgi:hypothetical protein
VTLALTVLLWAVTATVVGLGVVVLVGATIGLARLARGKTPADAGPTTLRPVQNWTGERP